MIYKGVSVRPRLSRVPTATNFLRGTWTQLPLHLSHLWQVLVMSIKMNKLRGEFTTNSLTDKTRQRPYTLPGKCNRVPDTLCHIGSGYSPIVGCFVRLFKRILIL